MWTFLAAGQRVVVERGPLAGAEGIVVSLKGRYRLVASIYLLQRSVAVEIDREWARPGIPQRGNGRQPFFLKSFTVRPGEPRPAAQQLPGTLT